MTRRTRFTRSSSSPGDGAESRHEAGRPGRLVYHCTGPGLLVPERISDPGPISDGEILTRLRSLTLCCTDVSNLHGAIGHGYGEPRILGHEHCNQVLESRVAGIEPGDYVVPLGDDFGGLAERAVIRPVLGSHDPGSIGLVYQSRGGYFDPDSSRRYKAVCVLPEWRSGISLLEPMTHVYTYFVTSRDARMARTVVVLGGGACGLFFCLFLKLFSAARNVVLVDVLDERLQRAEALGLADLTINPLRDMDRCRDLVAASSSAYADVVFDALPGIQPLGSPDARGLGVQMLRPDGEYIFFAASTVIQMPAIEMLAKGHRWHVAPYDSRRIDFTQRARLMERVWSMIESGQVQPEMFIAKQVDFYSTTEIERLFREYGRTPHLKVEVIA